MKNLTKPLDAIIHSIERRFNNCFSPNPQSKVAVIAVYPQFKMRWYNALNSKGITAEASANLA